MAKIYVCDICKKEGKLVETSRYMTVRGYKVLRLDYCLACKVKIPKGLKKYVKFVFELKNLPINDKIIESYLAR